MTRVRSMPGGILFFSLLRKVVYYIRDMGNKKAYIQGVIQRKPLLIYSIFIYFLPFPLNVQAGQNDTPVKLGIANIIDVMSNVNGGIRQDTVALYNLDVTAELDTGYYGLEDGTLFFYGLVTNSTELNPLTGDFQVSSNIDNGEVFRLYEFWYEQVFAGGRASVKTGLFDLNSEFDAIEPAGLFMNSSHGIGPDFSQTGANGPSIFPSTSLALRMQYQVSDRVLVRAVVLDAVPNDPDHPKNHKISLNEGALLVGEAEIALAEDWRAVLGVWHYTSKFTPLDEAISQQTGGNSGVYTFLEGSLNERTSVWFRIGMANQDINQLSHYIGGGIVYTGILPSRPDDTIGFAIAAAGNGAAYKEISARSFRPVDDYEITYELTYRFNVTPWLTLQPDVQYIQNPGMDTSVSDALVIGIRIEIGGEY